MWALNEILKYPLVRDILTNDFKCGYVAATIVFLFILLVVILIKIMVYLLCRTPKCSEVVVKNESGNLVISSRVISSLVSRELEKTARFEDVKVVVRQKKSTYQIGIRASYFEGEPGLPEVSESLKPQILELLKQQFGIESVESINFAVDRLAEKDEENGDTGF